jgi:hypothetical protein
MFARLRVKLGAQKETSVVYILSGNVPVPIIHFNADFGRFSSVAWHRDNEGENIVPPRLIIFSSFRNIFSYYLVVVIENKNC